MSKKDKKVFKKHSTLAPKVTLNRKWTVWRQPEIKNIISYSMVLPKLIASQFIAQDSFIDQGLMARIFHFSSFKGIRSSKIKNFCNYTGRSRGMNRDLFMSRHTIRRLARFGLLPGIIKERC